MLLTDRKGTSFSDKPLKASPYTVGVSVSHGPSKKGAPIDPKFAQETSPKVEGDEETEQEVNQSTEDVPGVDRLSTKEVIAKRQAVAQRLASIVDDVIQLLGKATMTTELQLFRRELSRSRPLIRELRTERDFLSIVTLVEASLENVDWKQLTKPELEEIRKALTIGATDRPISYTEVNRQARLLRSRGFQTLPVFEFDVNDVGNEEENEASPEAE